MIIDLVGEVIAVRDGDRLRSVKVLHPQGDQKNVVEVNYWKTDMKGNALKVPEFKSGQQFKAKVFFKDSCSPVN
jgi:hypothetical protein